MSNLSYPGDMQTTTNKTLQSPLLGPILWRNKLSAMCRSLERQTIVFILLTVMGTHC